MAKPKMTAGEKAHKRNLEDLIRDEIYAANIQEVPNEWVLVRKDHVKFVARKIVKRYLIGPR